MQDNQNPCKSHKVYKEGLIDAVFQLGMLYHEHESMGDDENALRGILEARNELSAYIMDLD